MLHLTYLIVGRKSYIAYLVLFYCLFEIRLVESGRILIYDFTSDEQIEDSLAISEVKTNYTPYYYARIMSNMSCGGAIIGHRWVLTAAYCIDCVKCYDSRYEVHIYRTQMFGRLNTYKTEELIRHPKYIPSRPRFYNIGLIKTQNCIEFSAYIYPIALVSYDFNFSEYAVLVSGYRLTKPNSRKSDFKDTPASSCRKLRDNDVCSTKLFSELSRPNLCVMMENQTRSYICHGEAGNPMVADGALIGVTTTTDSNCNNIAITIFTRVWTYRDWIMDIIGAPYDFKQPSSLMSRMCFLD